MLDGGGDASLLIPRGDDNREQRERSSKIGFRILCDARDQERSRYARIGRGQLGFIGLS
jgi:hypothetical protein